MSKMTNILTKDENFPFNPEEEKFELTDEMKYELDNTDINELIDADFLEELIDYALHAFEGFYSPTIETLRSRNDEDRETIINWHSAVFNPHEEIPRYLLNALYLYTGNELRAYLSHFPDRESIIKLDSIFNNGK